MVPLHVLSKRMKHPDDSPHVFNHAQPVTRNYTTLWDAPRTTGTAEVPTPAKPPKSQPKSRTAGLGAPKPAETAGQSLQNRFRVPKTDDLAKLTRTVDGGGHRTDGGHRAAAGGRRRAPADGGHPSDANPCKTAQIPAENPDCRPWHTETGRNGRPTPAKPVSRTENRRPGQVDSTQPGPPPPKQPRVNDRPAVRSRGLNRPAVRSRDPQPSRRRPPRPGRNADVRDQTKWLLVLALLEGQCSAVERAIMTLRRRP